MFGFSNVIVCSNGEIAKKIAYNQNLKCKCAAIFDAPVAEVREKLDISEKKFSQWANKRCSAPKKEIVARILRRDCGATPPKRCHSGSRNGSDRANH